MILNSPSRHPCLYALVLATFVWVFPARAGKPSGQHQSLPVLTRIREVRQLPSDQAALGYPVRLRGVVTYYYFENQDWFIQDSTAGIYIEPGDKKLSVHPGQLVEVEGVSASGYFAPMVVNPKFRVLGQASMPVPRRVSLEHIQTGQEDSQWVEVQGIIRSASGEGMHLTLEIVEGERRLKVFIPESHLPDAARLVDAKVRIRGVGAGLFNQKNQLIGVILDAPNQDYVLVAEPAPPDPYALPVRPINSLVRFTPTGASGHRARVQGVVTLQQGGSLFIKDQTESLHIETKQLTPVQPGDRLDVLGFPALTQYAPVLEDAIFRRSGSGPALHPLRITAQQALEGTHDAELVQIEARLLDRMARFGEQGLFLQAGQHIFTAHLEEAKAGSRLDSLLNGSLLRLSGICSVQVDENRVPRSFRILLRAPADIVVLDRPSWWTLEHMLWAVGAMAGLILAAMAWVVVLRSRVDEHTAVLRESLQREAGLKERYRELFENANDIIFTHDLTGKFTSLNKAGERIAGYRRAEVLNMNLTQIAAPEYAELARRMIERTLAGEGPPAYELEIMSKDRRRVALEVSSRLIYEGGNPAGVQGIARDITERKRAEEAVRLSEERFHKAFNASPEPMTISTLSEGRYIDVNESFLRITGHRRQEVIGRSAIQLKFWREPKQRAQLLSLLQETGQVHDVEVAFGTKSGQTRVGLLSAEVIEIGGERCLLAVTKDVTERKRAEEELRRLNRALKALIQCNEALVRATHEATFLGDICRIIVDTGGYRYAWVGFIDPNSENSVSPAAEAGYGKGRLDTLTTTSAKDHQVPTPTGTAVRTGRCCVVRNIHAELEYPQWRAEALKYGYGSSIAVPLMITGSRPFGALTIHAEKADAFDSEEVKLLTELAGDLAYGIMALRTRAVREQAEEELRESEERYRQLVERNLAGVFRIALDPRTLEGRILDCNDAFARIFGYPSREEIIASWAADLYLNPADGGGLLSQLREKKTLTNHEVRLWRKDGSPAWVLQNVSLIEPQDSLPILIEGTLIDITERKHLEDQLRQSQKMEAVGRLAGGVAHDFNNLLTIIMGYSQLLLDRLGPGEAMRWQVDEIKKAGERAASLTRQLLAFSREQVLKPHILDLNSVVANMEKMLRRLIGEDIELVTVPGANLGRVKADPGQIEQVLMNLAVNARDAMPQGGKLTIETGNVDLGEGYARSHVTVRPGPYVMMAVSDTGCGMDAETQSHIFEPFFTTKDKDKGTGLGLATVYGIVKQSGGYIWVYSEPGRGSTFKVYLPQVQEAAEAAESEKAIPAPMRGTETILVVEDEESVRSLVRGVLQAHGYTVLEARRGDEALQVSDRHKGLIHLLLTDVVMPQMSGRDLAARLVASHSESRVLYMSGYTDRAILHQGVLDAKTHFIGKPFTPDALARKVREVLDE